MLAVVTLPKDCPGQAIQNPSFKEPKFLAEANSLNSTFLHKSIKTPAPNSVLFTDVYIVGRKAV